METYNVIFLLSRLIKHGKERDWHILYAYTAALEVGSIDGLITLRPHLTVIFTYSIQGYFRNCSGCDYHMRNRPVAS
jgi:hypothetical protein